MEVRFDLVMAAPPGWRALIARWNGKLFIGFEERPVAAWGQTISEPGDLHPLTLHEDSVYRVCEQLLPNERLVRVLAPGESAEPYKADWTAEHVKDGKRATPRTII